MSPYFQVFFEAFGHAQLVPLSTHATLFAMRAFGGFNVPLAIGLAFAGSIAGELVSWLIGYGLSVLRLRTPHRLYIPDAHYARAQHIARFALPLLLFAWWGLGSVFVVAAGFLRVRWWVALLWVAAGYAAFYAIALQ